MKRETMAQVRMSEYVLRPQNAIPGVYNLRKEEEMSEEEHPNEEIMKREEAAKEKTGSRRDFLRKVKKTGLIVGMGAGLAHFTLLGGGKKVEAQAAPGDCTSDGCQLTQTGENDWCNWIDADTCFGKGSSTSDLCDATTSNDKCTTGETAYDDCDAASPDVCDPSYAGSDVCDAGFVN